VDHFVAAGAEHDGARNPVGLGIDVARMKPCVSLISWARLTLVIGRKPTSSGRPVARLSNRRKTCANSSPM
jgi:hypothetical protein